MNDIIQIKVKGGYIVATMSSDPNYPGIDVEYITYDDHGQIMSRPRVLIEYPEDGTLRALVWNDPHNEDYTEEINLL